VAILKLTNKVGFRIFVELYSTLSILFNTKQLNDVFVLLEFLFDHAKEHARLPFSIGYYYNKVRGPEQQFSESVRYGNGGSLGVTTRCGNSYVLVVACAQIPPLVMTLWSFKGTIKSLYQTRSGKAIDSFLCKFDHFLEFSILK